MGQTDVEINLIIHIESSLCLVIIPLKLLNIIIFRSWDNVVVLLRFYKSIFPLCIIIYNASLINDITKPHVCSSHVKERFRTAKIEIFITFIILDIILFLHMLIG